MSNFKIANLRCYYIIKNKKNKKRANELDDDFIYDEKEKDKLGIN